MQKKGWLRTTNSHEARAGTGAVRLEVAGIGLRAGVPASQVTTSHRRSALLSTLRPPATNAPVGPPRTGAQLCAGAAAVDDNQACVRARRFLERCQAQIWQGESLDAVFASMGKNGDETIDVQEMLECFRKINVTLNAGARANPSGISPGSSCCRMCQ
jgi:hypothetical protein